MSKIQLPKHIYDIVSRCKKMYNKKHNQMQAIYSNQIAREWMEPEKHAHLVFDVIYSEVPFEPKRKTVSFREALKHFADGGPITSTHKNGAGTVNTFVLVNNRIYKLKQHEKLWVINELSCDLFVNANDYNWEVHEEGWKDLASALVGI